MLSKRIKSVVALSALVVASSSLANSSIAPTHKSTNSVQTTANENGFIYPTPTLAESDFIETGVMFVYSDHILDYFNGDSEQLLKFINSNIEHNNQAFINSNIAIKRVVSGLKYVKSDEIWTSNNTYTERLHALANWQRSEVGTQLKQERQYSYLVSLAGYQKSEGETTMLGQAFVGDNVSWIAPFNTDANLWIERTLSHELSHSDGFKHKSSDYQDGASFIARHDAAGYECGSHGSIMYVSGLRTEPFFSDPEISHAKNQEEIQCGEVGEANAAQAYRDLLKTTFANSESTFSNIQPTRPKSGVVSIQENISLAMEGDNIEFDIVFEGADAGDSINFVVRQGTADLEDFESTIGTVIHDGINNVYTLTIPTLTDKINESIEHFSVELIYPNGLRIDDLGATIQVSIVDKNDEVGYAEFATTDISVEEGNDAEITIKRVSGNEGLMTYRIETSTDTASLSDFESTSQEITFANGETSKTIRIKTIADTNNEQDETFTLSIIQTLHPLYALQAEAIKSKIKITINNPVAVNNAATNSNAVAASTPATASAPAGQASGGSLNIFWAIILLIVVVRRQQLS